MRGCVLGFGSESVQPAGVGLQGGVGQRLHSLVEELVDLGEQVTPGRVEPRRAGGSADIAALGVSVQVGPSTSKQAGPWLGVRIQFGDEAGDDGVRVGS